MKHLTVDIAVATAGRRDLLSEVIPFLNTLDPKPHELLICPASPDDVDVDLLEGRTSFRIVPGEKGLPLQRNALMRASRADVMVFLDDDFLPASDFVAEAERLFRMHTDVVIATGLVLADGILGPGLEFSAGRKILECSESSRTETSTRLEKVYNAYGCNMLVRMDIVRKGGYQFDEELPSYAWLEDLDFSRQLKTHGSIVKSSRLRGVHLGTKKAGRSPGKRLGYSQIANPIYLARKGTMSWPRALNQMARNLCANSAKSFISEPWTDRPGRLRGNALAIWELVSGKMKPSRVLEIRQ